MKPRIPPLQPPLSRAAREARRPRPPAELVDALQDRVHKEIGKYRAGKSVKEKP